VCLHIRACDKLLWVEQALTVWVLCVQELVEFPDTQKTSARTPKVHTLHLPPASARMVKSAASSMLHRCAGPITESGGISGNQEASQLCQCRQTAGV
jgi:hypothetical protein